VVRDLVGRRDAAKCALLEILVNPVLGQHAREPCIHEARSDQVHGDAVASDFPRQRLDEAAERRLRGGVVDGCLDQALRREVANREDAAASGLYHVAQDRARE